MTFYYYYYDYVIHLYNIGRPYVRIWSLHGPTKPYTVNEGQSVAFVCDARSVTEVEPTVTWYNPQGVGEYSCTGLIAYVNFPL